VQTLSRKSHAADDPGPQVSGRLRRLALPHLGQEMEMMNMDLRYRGLAGQQFAPLFSLADEALAARGIRRMKVEEKPGFPCRISLEDAEPGETVLLLPFEHQRAHSPYRSSGPIFVREGQFDAFAGTEPPPVFKGRLLSARSYAQDGMMLDADVAEGYAIVPVLQRFLESPEAAYVHVHNAKRGCYSCRVERV
jgi:hypothetical protein